MAIDEIRSVVFLTAEDWRRPLLLQASPSVGRKGRGDRRGLGASVVSATLLRDMF
jgi:hypothetical protein